MIGLWAWDLMIQWIIFSLYIFLHNTKRHTEYSEMEPPINGMIFVLAELGALIIHCAMKDA